MGRSIIPCSLSTLILEKVEYIGFFLVLLHWVLLVCSTSLWPTWLLHLVENVKDISSRELLLLVISSLSLSTSWSVTSWLSSHIRIHSECAATAKQISKWISSRLLEEHLEDLIRIYVIWIERVWEILFCAMHVVHSPLLLIRETSIGRRYILKYFCCIFSLIFVRMVFQSQLQGSWNACGLLTFRYALFDLIWSCVFTDSQNIIVVSLYVILELIDRIYLRDHSLYGKC